jgi:hypothetical protein
MSKVLLREYYELCPGGICQDLLTEDEKRQIAEGATIMTGILQKAGTRNGNGRVYPRKVLEREMSNYQKIIKDNRALGELDHPEDSVINLKNTSHIVTAAWFEGDTVLGKVRILDTPSGKILQALIKDGVKLGISSRGLGSVRESSGDVVVEDDFQLICFDFVSEPSTPDAYMHVDDNITEGKKKIFSRVDRVNRALNNIVSSERD